MKFIDKDKVPVPQILTTQGTSETKKNKKVYSENKKKYTSNTPTIQDKSAAPSIAIDSKIYGDETVKSALIQLQNKSCCFCESRVTHISFGDVEHYRLKAGYFQDEGDLFHKPGYFWLAYEWSNLLFCCKICNRRYKQNFFPLKDPAKRCKFNKSFSVKSEAPLFINPFETDPAEHITFNKEIPVGKTEEGRVTISKLGLLREELNEMRRDTLSSLLALKQCWEINQGTAAESQIKRLFLDNLKEKIADCG